MGVVGRAPRYSHTTAFRPSPRRPGLRPGLDECERVTCPCGRSRPSSRTVVVAPGPAQLLELALPLHQEVVGPLQVAVQDVHAVGERLEADAGPCVRKLGGSLAVLGFGQVAAVCRPGQRRRDRRA